VTGDDTIVDLDAFRHAASGRTDGDVHGTTSTAAYHDRALVAGLKVAFENLAASRQESGRESGRESRQESGRGR
jgi:hypothetical protein